MHSKISDHKLEKGVFITPLNNVCEIMDEVDSWGVGKVPEFLWIGMILDYYDRDDAINRLSRIMEYLHDIAPKLEFPKISAIHELDEKVQDCFYRKLHEVIEPIALTPLTLFFTYSTNRLFSRYFYLREMTIDARIKRLEEVLRKTLSKDSEMSSDIQYLVAFFFTLSRKLVFAEGCINPIAEFQKSDLRSIKHRISASGIRAFLTSVFFQDKTNVEFIKWFWDKALKLSECEAYNVNRRKDTGNMNAEIKVMEKIFKYYIEMYKTGSALNDKMQVVLGLSIFAFKRFKELVEHDLEYTISGRSCSRGIAESYIMLKYLLGIEKTEIKVWKEYQLYGLGKYKGILKAYQEVIPEERYTQITPEYLEMLVNEFISEEAININTNYFKANIRTKAKSINEEKLYGQIYEYDSMFEHCIWGAIRESVFLKCDNPLHLYHCVPDLDNAISLESVSQDCVKIMGKIVLTLIDLYGLPQELVEEWEGLHVR